MSVLPLEKNSIVHASEDAVKSLSALSKTGSSPSEIELDGSTDYTFTDEIQRLRLWILEHQVATGKLDHKLRESSQLRDQVLSLLLELHSLEIQNERSESSASTGVRAAIDRKGRPLDIDTNVAISSDEESPMREDEPEESSSSIDTGFTPDSLPDTPLTRAHDVITLLMQLGPSLLDPTPHNRFELSAKEVGAEFDINHVLASFPKADESLVMRLGGANWDRRQFLRNLRNALEENPPREDLGKDLDEPILQTMGLEPLSSAAATASEQSNDANGNASADSDNTDVSDGGFSDSDVSLSESQPKTATTNTGSDFHFSLDETQSTVLTEPSKFVQQTNPTVFDDGQRYRAPRPPKPNEDLIGKNFVCPYCCHMVSEMTSLLHWKKHVTADLEPYMCTYKDCARSAKTYGSRKAWWQHEIEKHRANYAWVCNPCQDKPVFETSAALDEHIMKDHTVKLTAMQLHSVHETCRREISRDAPRSVCPLCQTMIVSGGRSDSKSYERAIKKHVSHHLEQLAYFVAVPAGQMLLNEDDPEFADDSDSEYGPLQSEIMSVVSRGTHLSKKQVQLENVNAFIADQRRSSDDIGQTPIPGVSAGHERSGVKPASSQGARPMTPKFPIQILMHPPNEHFYARQRLLTDANKVLRSPGQVCIFFGVGGVGKTLAAVEYIYSYKEHYDAIFWLQADTAPGLADSYLQMAMSLALVNESDDQNHVIDKGRMWLQDTKRRWLLIFDNALLWEDIARYMPNSVQHSNGSVLITTQAPNNFLPNANNVERMRLDPLDQKAGADMLLRYLGRDLKADPELHLAKEISAFVGGLPVAIGHVAGYVSFSEGTLEELIETFREWRKRTGVATDEADDLPVAFREAAFSYDGALAMVWEVTLRELTEDARDLVHILAYLNCASVPQDMLWRVHEDESLQFLDIREKQRKRKTYNSLTKRRLVAVDAEENFSIHRSLQRGIREKLAKSKGKQQTVFDQAVTLVREVFPQSNPLQQPSPDKWPECRKLLPHLHALHDVYQASRPHIKGSLDFAQLLLDAGMDQFEQSITFEALLLLYTAEQVLDASSPEDHLVMKADIHAMIGIMYDNTGIQQRADAFKRRKEALSIRKQVFEEADPPKRHDEILLYNSWMEYAISLLHYHRYEQAEPIIEKCLVKYNEWGPESEYPFEYAKYYNKIALVRMYQGRFNEAIDLAEKSVQLMHKAGFGLFMTRFKFDMACIILQSGDMDRALQLHHDIYNQRTETVGNTNELSLHSMYAIGAIYELKEDYHEAEIWFRKVLDQRRSVISWPEEALSRAQFHMSQVLFACGRAEDVETANAYRERALAVLHRLLPSDMAPELVDVTDESILFDHMLPVTPGGPRYTGKGLLECFMKKA